MISKLESTYRLFRREDFWVIEFTAMGGPCEILLKSDCQSEAERLASLAFLETLRIEQKYSRYRDDNIVHRINNAHGRSVALDSETSRLLEYAGHCFKLSEGLFDITSGVLRRAWKFQGQETVPDAEKIRSLLELVGWGKVELKEQSFRMPENMEIDFGGLGKEYAVDKVAEMVFRDSGFPVMVNFGGDIRALSGKKNGSPWLIGIENPHSENGTAGTIELKDGAVATSGDSRRYCLVAGERLGHILNPHTGWPVRQAPQSVTVIAERCTEAGLLATLAMLQGRDAESFLALQGVTYHCIR